jgi:hypothetical protein
MRGLHGSAFFGRRLIGGVCLLIAAGAMDHAHAQGPLSPEDQKVKEGNAASVSADELIKSAELLPCLDQATRDKVNEAVAKAIKFLNEVADFRGDRFVNADKANPEDAIAAANAIGQIVRLKKELAFVEAMPSCTGPAPKPPTGGGGLTDGPTGGDDGPSPPSQTQIPPCLNDVAKELIELLEKKIPQEEETLKNYKTEMDDLKKQLGDLLDAKAAAAQKGQSTVRIEDQIRAKMIDYSGLAFKRRTVQIQHDQDVEDLKKLKALKPCPPDQHGYYVRPGYGGGEQYVTYATDSTTHCTYTGATFTTSLVTTFDDGPPGVVVPGPDAPPSSGAPSVSRPQTAAAPDQPGKPVDKAATPPTTDTTPPAPDDTPSDIPDNVELKVTQDVLEGGQTGGPIEGQTIKLTLAEKSDLPVPVDPKAPLSAKKTSVDTKFDRPPNQCTTDAKGGCSIPVAADDRSSFRLPSPRKGVHRTYRLEIARPQTSGGVAEITPGKDKIDPKALQNIGNKVVSSTFKIGNRSFIRFALETKYGVDTSLAPKLKEAYGPSYEEDICKEKYPGRLLVEETPGALDTGEPELPGTTIRLRVEQTKRRVSR